MVELKARPPVWCPQQSLQCTGKIHKHIAHQEEPKGIKKEELNIQHVSSSLARLNLNSKECACALHCTYMDRMGATESSDAMMIPISQMLAVSSRAHVGSPLALP